MDTFKHKFAIDRKKAKSKLKNLQKSNDKVKEKIEKVNIIINNTR